MVIYLVSYVNLRLEYLQVPIVINLQPSLDKKDVYAAVMGLMSVRRAELRRDGKILKLFGEDFIRLLQVKCSIAGFWEDLKTTSKIWSGNLTPNVPFEIYVLYGEEQRSSSLKIKDDVLN